MSYHHLFIKYKCTCQNHFTLAFGELVSGGFPHCIIEEFEDIKEEIRIRQSKDRQHNVQKKKDKRTNNNQEKIIKLKIK
jgi:hypothetical protein